MIYIYIYIHTHTHTHTAAAAGVRPDAPTSHRRRSADSSTKKGARLGIRGKYYTPDLTQMDIHWKMSLKVQRTIPVNIKWTSDNPWEKQGRSLTPLI